MINKDRMTEEFIELASIDSVTFHERQIADVLKLKLGKLGLSVFEDDTGEKINGSAGNLISVVKGTKPVPAILLMAHMDTVIPGKGKKPVIDGNIIKSDGTTILGGDDISGVECILEAVRVLKEECLKHGDIIIVFSVAEEGGLFGARHLNYDIIPAKFGFVLDGGGSIGTVTTKAPTQNKVDVRITGKAAHAGVEPEKGISAIQIAAEAISHMKLGRIDGETTSNIGIIKGGHATNIVCDRVDINAEVRSRNRDKLEIQTNHMKECFDSALAKFGGSVEFKAELCYPAFNIDESDGIVGILKNAAAESGVELKLEASGGGSDANIVNGKGIQTVVLSTGMDKVHTVNEQISVDDLVKAAEFLVAIIKNVE